MVDSSKLYAFIQNLIREVGGNPQLTEQQSLILSGVLDSLAATKLVVFLEKEYDLILSERVADISDIDSVEKILNIIQQPRSS